MLNFIPFTGSWGETARLDDHPGLVSETLKFAQPHSRSRAVAPVAIRRDEQTLGGDIPFPAHPVPPAKNRGDGKLRCIVSYPHRYAGFIVAHIIYAVWNGFSQINIGKVMCFNIDWITLTPICFPRVFQVSEYFLLFRVDRYCLISPPLAGLHARGDELELGVTIAVLISFHGLAIRSKTTPERFQQRRDFGAAHNETLCLQLDRERMRAFATPSQRRNWIATRYRIEKILQSLDQTGLFFFARTASCSQSPLSAGMESIWIIEFEYSIPNRPI